MAKREKKSFPQFPVKHWWTLRKKFQRSIPGTVTPNYLSSVLGMKETSARDNVYLYLKQMGIIDQDGKATPRATKWRDDHDYSKVCENIVKEIYPSELTDAVPDPNTGRDVAARWFANHTGAGTGSVSKMVKCYVLLRDGDTSNAPKRDAKKRKAKKESTVKKKTSSPDNKMPVTPEKVDQSIHKAGKFEKRTSPDICINLQIHISSDASTDQIDQIFASMAKHIYNK